MPQSPGEDGMPTHHRSSELHSTLSPLSPGSPIYPDGVMTPLWFAKHQQLVPSLLIAFFNVSASDDTAQNEQIQVDINAVRTALSRSGYKSRFAVVLMSDKSILHAPELEDRLSAIRRATTMDPKTGLFFMPPMSSQAEIAAFVHSMLQTLQPLVVEYYRDLTKHARRKKTRAGSTSVVSPVERGGHALSGPGWNVRYEVKQGAFAQFRQEMDVAERHYSTAIEALFSSEGVLETTPSWSPRWSEARLLCDILAVRTVRCQLWTAQTTGAAVSWVNYKFRFRDLVDRRGKGSETYGWQAWESRWAKIMAQLIRRAALPISQPPLQASSDSVELAASNIFAPAEKSSSTTDRTTPFDLLHHPGYWLRLSFHAAVARREKALNIPEEDRIPPSQSPASAVAHRSRTYDTYLALEPHEECTVPLPSHNDHHLTVLQELADEAAQEFTSRGQIRSAERIRFELARQIVSAGRYEDASTILQPLWEDCTWRENDWDNLLHPLLEMLHKCAAHVHHAEVFMSTAWELLGLGLWSLPKGQSDLLAYVEDSITSSEKFGVKMSDRQRQSPIKVSFAFGDKQTRVGEPVQCQVSLKSQVAPDAVTLQPSEVELTFSDSRSVTITHKRNEEQKQEGVSLVDLAGSETNEVSLTLEADLNLPPSTQRAYNFLLSFRESTEVRLSSATVKLDSHTCTLEHCFTDQQLLKTSSMYLRNRDVLEERQLPWPDTMSLCILPKPPKMQIALLGLHKQYYVDEHIHLALQLTNSEAEAVNASAVLREVGKSSSSFMVYWDDREAVDHDISIGRLDHDGSHTVDLRVEAPSEAVMYTFEVEIKYFLESDADTPLVKALSVELNILNPFAAKYSFGPLLHADPWPGYFSKSRDQAENSSEGIPHQWRLGAELTCTSEDNFIVRRMGLVLDQIPESTTCDIAEADFEEQRMSKDKQTLASDFQFITRKASLDDRRPTELELSLELEWCREAGGSETTSRLRIPRLQLPSSEPRVLCTVGGSVADTDQILLRYHLENPSTHFLTFAMTLGASEDFAFSGPKHRALSLAPFSRLSVDYRLLVHERGEQGAQENQSEGRWIWPALEVVDSYYQKTLKVHSGGPRVKIDENRGLGVQVEK